MIIGIIADTHDSVENFSKTLDFLREKKIDLIIHLGDWVSPFMINVCQNLEIKIIVLFGNNDTDVSRHIGTAKKFGLKAEFIKKSGEKEIDGRKIFLCHGTKKELLQEIKESGKYDAVFSGHTHIARIEKIGKTLCINPGPVCGIVKITDIRKPTVALYDTASNSAEIMTVE